MVGKCRVAVAPRRYGGSTPATRRQTRGRAGALALAVAIARSATAYKAIYPFLVIKQSTPIIAIAPIIVVMVGTGLAAKAIVACMVSLSE